MLTQILLGLSLGSLTSGAWAWFFMVTRRYRKTLRLSVIASCQIAFVILNFGSAYLVMVGLPGGDVAGGAYIIALGIGSCIVYRSEMRWRKESGISK